MKFTIEKSKNKNLFVCYTVDNGVENAMYVGTDITFAIMIRDILNACTNFKAVYTNGEGVFFQTYNMDHPVKLTKWDMKEIPVWPDDKPVIQEKDMDMEKLNIHDWARNIPTELISTPDHKLRSQIWYNTYLSELKNTGSVICASADADAQLEKFDSLFTTKTQLI